MKHIPFYLLLMLTLPAVFGQAQDRPLSIHWKIAGALLLAKEQSHALGVAGPVAGLHNNVLLVAGGSNFPDAMPWLGGSKTYYSEGTVFRRDENNALQSCKTFQLPFSLAYAAICSTPMGVVAAGGENEQGLRKNVLLLQWDGTDSTVAVKQLPALPFAVTNASIVFHQNKLYLAGGERARDVSNELLVLDPGDTAAGWKSLALLPRPVSHTVLVVQSNGKEDGLYLLGGRKRNPGDVSDLFSSVYRFDWQKKAWAEESPLPYALSAGTGVAAGSHFILLFGGDTGETFHKTEVLIAAIGKEASDEKKNQLTKEKVAVQSSHPGFCRQVLLYDTKKKKWAPQDCIPFAAPVTTTAVQWNNVVYLPCGEIKAGVRTPQILAADLTGF